MWTLDDSFAALIDGRHHDPFSLLGVHRVGRDRVVRALQPHASKVELIGADGRHLADMERVHKDGLFAALMPPPRIPTGFLSRSVTWIFTCWAKGRTRESTKNSAHR
jgi:hypothetical protein